MEEIKAPKSVVLWLRGLGPRNVTDGIFATPLSMSD